MARRVIATAEVQVAADIGQAEAGLNGLTSSFRVIGAIAEKAAERAEIAFLSSSRTIADGLEVAQEKVVDLAIKLDRGGDAAQQMAAHILTVAARIEKADAEGRELTETISDWANLLRQAAGMAGAVDAGLDDVAASAERASRSAQEIEGEIRAAAARAEMLARAFRDVGQDMELALAGGFDQLDSDIRSTIRRLNDLGGEFQDVGRIGEAALNGIAEEADENLEQAASAALRLARQLEGIEAAELRRIDDDARAAAAAMNNMSDSARRADRSIDGIGTVARRASGDVRGLVGLIGAAGLGFAAASAARAGLDMTVQLEKSSAMFLGLTGTVEGAADMLERMVIFARETPYNLANVSDAAAQLLAVGDGFGVTTGNMEEFLTSFGDAIAATGGGEEQFTRLVRVFGQMSSSGKVLGQDMNQLAQNLPGFDVWQALADGTGKSVKELRELQDLGTLDNLLTGNEAVRYLIEGMEQIPGAAGAMERRMNTLGGAIEKFRETAQFAISEGMIPFSEAAQDVLSDPVILNSVEDMSFAFGDLLTSALQEVAPEFDDLAAGVESVLGAFQSWAPVLAQVADSVADFLEFISPIVSGLGEATSAVLGFGDGLGKMAVAAGLFAAGGPIGIAGGVLLGVSGALDMFAGDTQRAAETARILAAAQGEVNTAMAEGEEAIYSEAQQQAITQAQDIIDNYSSLATAMRVANNETGLGAISVGQLNQAFADLASGTDITDENVLSFLETIDRLRNDGKSRGDGIVEEFDAYQAAWKTGTTVVQEESEKQTDLLRLAGTEDIAVWEERQKAAAVGAESIKGAWENVGAAHQEAFGRAAEISAGWGTLDEERTDSLRTLLEEQASEYADWAVEIDESTAGAALSLESVAEEAENSARRMIDAINENSAATFDWKNNIVAAGVGVQQSLGLTDTEAQEFMGTLGEMGPAAAPALAEMVADFQNGGTLLTDFFNANKLNADVMATGLTDAFDEATGSVPTLAESLSEGTLTVEALLATLPAAMEAAGMDLEAAAAAIDASDEMGIAGQQAVDGLVNAIGSPSAMARARAAGVRLGAAAVAGVKSTEALNAHSPSRAMIDIGEFAVEGLVIGMDSMSDEAYAQAVQTASLISGGIEWHFRKAEKPQEEARKFAQDVAETIIDELIAEQENVADAAEELAEAAADRLSEAWDRVKDRFLNRDLAEGVAEAQADLAEARSELAAAEALTGTAGSDALAAAQQRINVAQQRINESKAALAAAEAMNDTAEELLAEQTLKDFKRQTEDAVAALKDQQEAETADINARIADAKRRLDPVARAAAEADLAASKERHEAEMTALDRQREDEQEVLQLRLDNENEARDQARELAIETAKAQVDIFEQAFDDATDAFDDIGDKIADAIKDLPGLREGIGDAQRDVEEAFFRQFEELLENVSSVDQNLLRSVGANAGLTPQEVNDLIVSAQASESASAGAAAANLGVGQLLELLSTGLFTLGANGALGIAAGLSSEAQAIADALFGTVENAVANTLGRLEIHSPSGVTEDLIGKPMAEGIAVGLMKAESAVSSAMTGLLDNVMGGVRVPPSSQLVANRNADSGAMMSTYRGPLVTMPGAVIQDATDADLVAQRVVVALSATGIDI